MITHKNFILILLISLLMLGSCLPSSSTSSSRTSSSATTEEEDTTEDPEFEDEDDTYWYSGGESYDYTITINEDIDTVIYLRGESIHDFLSGESTDDDSITIDYEDLTYCMVASYNTTGAEKNLRVRAVPISFYNFSTNTQERLFRIDLPEEDSSTDECSGTAYQILTTVDSGTSVSDSDSVFIPSELCPDCNKTVTSTDVSIYFSNDPLTINDRVPESLLNLGSIILRVSSSSSSDDTSSGSCTDSACVAKGYDCCLDGQCVNDGTLRSDADEDSDFAQAIADVATNPSNFINWPSIYYVCGSTPAQADPTPTDGPDAEATAAAYLQSLIDDWKCLSEAAVEEPDYSGKEVCAPDYDEDSYTDIRSKVWAYCGCSATPFPTDPDESTCPDYTLKAYDEDGEEIDWEDEDFDEDEIYSVECYAPEAEPEPTPFQNLSLSVSSRSIPHRFFSSEDGEAIDDLEDIEDTSITPEGTPFQYIDSSSKTDPDCSGTDGSSTSECTFNMNSILGQMTVDLTQARPAQVVELDYDQSYIISAISGYYTPCPQCDSDYWFQSFTAFPASQMGVGLEGVNYGTDRTSYNSNTGLGNYEDTIFGRACFVPPTMIPFSHVAKDDVIEQRSSRLLTQAALYVNGYQRDWWGFNRGALIGSFDGVKWFAIGKNRRVTATSSKLFLAINAPFGDLAENTDLTVQVILDEGTSTAPSYDYDPNEEPDSVYQGTAASCQRWHQCDVDTDCITRLGWEYMCVDTSIYKSKWPKFNIYAEETEDDEYDAATFSRILQDGVPSGSKKRCVYRGAGAVCKGDFTSNLSSARQKMFACAPNFHCEALDSNNFNNDIIRTPAQTGNILYGMDSDVLGRPENYLEGESSLPEDAIEAIRHSAENYTTETDDIGLCRPGRKINQTTFINQHAASDTSGRTDYISQVGTCDSSTTGSTRVLGCPIIQREEDQDEEVGDLIFEVGTTQQTIQNSCGGESQATISNITTSLFASIEAEPLLSVASLTAPTMAADACIRRAGSVCHTDLDCTPNRMHETVSYNYGQEQFGGTEAEMLFWQESLVCGQSEERPTNTADDYYDYDMSLNRCCREVGNDFTMYTQGDPQTETLNSALSVTTFPYDDPGATGRYSRYVISGTVDDSTADAMGTPYAQAPIIDQAAGTMPKAFQWKTFNDTASLTCCGGGWVRKFSDGTTNWEDANRLEIDPTEFQCLNYAMEIPESDTDTQSLFYINTINFAKELDRYCLSPYEGGCAQVEFTEPASDGLLTPPKPKGTSPYSITTAILDTTPYYAPAEEENDGMANLSFNVPYEPIPYSNTTEISSNSDDIDDDYSYFFNSTYYQAVSFYLPSYVGYINSLPVGASNNLLSVTFVYYDEDGNELGTSTPTQVDGTDADCTSIPTSNPIDWLEENEYCIYESSSLGRIFHGRAPVTNLDDGTYSTDDLSDWDYAAVQIEFNVPNSTAFLYSDGGTDSSREGMIRGNEMYYLTKLARLELLGIPQIVYEPIYCNENKSKVIEGIFSDISSRDDVLSNGMFHSMSGANYNVNGRTLLAMYDDRYESSDSSTNTAVYDTDDDGTAGETTDDNNDYAHYYDTDGDGTIDDRNERYAFFDEDDFDLPQIFSSNEFKCCVKLGQESTEAGNCCSGFMDDDNICKLPSGTNLYVYFNRFVSGEGVGEDEPGGGLDDDDFIPETGEPKISSTVQNKIEELGEAYCENEATRGGGAFGYYYPEPNSGVFYHREDVDAEDTRMYSIVDSTGDFDDDNEAGITPFLSGYRWNHHVYCE